MGHWAICTTVIGSFLLLISNKININSKSLYFWLSFSVHRLFSFVFCLCQLFLFLLCYLSILLAVSLAVLHLLRLPSKKRRRKKSTSCHELQKQSNQNVLNYKSSQTRMWLASLMAFLKNTLSCKYWLVRDCCVIWVAWGNSVIHFTY